MSQVSDGPTRQAVHQKVISSLFLETLRKWPPAVILDRVCTQPYDMKVDGRTYKMDVGDMLWIPVLGIHRDPKYYPDPERFDPERFKETNKAQINPAAFLPFGLGPRNCIGSR